MAFTWRCEHDRGVMRGWRPVWMVLSVLVVTDVALINQSMVLTVPVACVATALLVYLAHRDGLSWADLGLGRSSLPRGLAWGAVAVVLVVVGYTVVLLSPWGHDVLGDDARTPQNLNDLLVKVLVVIPLRTILLEEVAFRGVLWGLLRARTSGNAATAGSAAAFGLWHLAPAALLIQTNANLAVASDGSSLAAVGVVLGIVVFTGIAGVVFAELRRRSGSLLAPMGLHAAVNIVGTVASYLA